MNRSIEELLLVVRRLPASRPETDRLAKSGYTTHKDHWLAWAGQYNDDDGGYYGRSDTTVADARTLYNRLNCGPMILWLAESAGAGTIPVRMAINDMKANGGGRAQTEAKIARKHFPWERMATLLFK
jgi:hypothetical protein